MHNQSFLLLSPMINHRETVSMVRSSCGWVHWPEAVVHVRALVILLGAVLEEAGGGVVPARDRITCAVTDDSTYRLGSVQ